MSRPALEVADIFRSHGPAWRQANAGHVSLGQLKVMSAIESCRTAALGGHVARCEKCAHTQIAYNSCRNRHCPKCQGAAAKEWLAEREAELLPVPYYHVVFTLPAQVADIAYQNKAAIYGILFKASAEALITIAADPKHLGARVGVLSVLHTWGSALTHHPHVHMIVPGGGISLDGKSWVSCRPGFFLPVRVLSRLFRRLFLEKLVAAHRAAQLQFFGKSCAADGSASLRRLLGAAAQKRMGCLQQTAVRRSQGSVALPRALHPPRGNLQPPPDRARRQKRHLQVEGLPRSKARALQADDARNPRVHPPVPDAQPAPAKAGCCHRASTASATTACSPTPPALATSHVPERCSQCQCSRSMPSMPPAPRPTNRKHQSIPAPAAAAA